ncbi:MAG: YjiH family protein [Clostridiales bacterium]|nr:YjiH family protein [Clostridiales bacterium]
MSSNNIQGNIYNPANVFRFLFFSIFGMILFFVPFTINGVNTIPLDHVITWLNTVVPVLGPTVTLIIVIIGGIMPWFDRTFKQGALNFIMAIFRTLGIPLAFMMYFNFGPAILMTPNMLPFIWEKVVVSVTVIVILGSIFLTFIIAFGCLEFIGVIVRPIMRPLYNTPGKSAIDAVASFVGSFSVAIYLTNKLYTENKYTLKEAMIIMTGFSTVSATFMIIVAKTAGFMPIWNFYFWSTLVICFVVTAITVRMWPLTSIPDEYADGVGHPEVKVEGKSIFRQAWDEGLEAAYASKNFFRVVWDNLLGGIKMCFVLSPIMASIGTLSFVLINLTPFFNIVGFIHYPWTFIISLFGIPEPMTLAIASTATLAEMFVPNVVVKALPETAKYVIAVTSVSCILFFAGSLPCMLATPAGQKVPFWKILVVWYERTALSIIISGIVAIIYF